jgi:hypothetical protein
MYAWLEGLIVVVTAATILYMLSRTAPKSLGLVSRRTLDWTEGIRQK